MTTVEKINVILREANISKVNLAKYLNVSRQMVYNYLDGDDLSKLSNDKCQLLFKLLNVKTEEELKNVELTDEYIQQVGNKIFNSKKNPVKKSEIIELTGLRKEEQDLISDIVFQFLQAVGNNKEMKYILGYVSKSLGYTNPNVYAFEEEQQFIFESIMYSAMTLYNNGGASRSKLAESHKRWEMELSRKNEEKLSRTQELNTAKVQALRELGYDEINENNAGEVFDKIAEMQSRWASV